MQWSAQNLICIQKSLLRKTNRLAKRSNQHTKKSILSKSIISFIKFNKFEDLTEKDLTYLNFLSTFLHQPKKFISPVFVNTNSWGGLMEAIGCRNSSDKDKIVGKYIKNPPEVHAKSHYFKSMSNTMFEANCWFEQENYDSDYISQFYFSMFLPNFTSDCSLASQSSDYDTSSGLFAFSDYKFGINSARVCKDDMASE
ncbi:hypothetical protein VP01_688g3 [Puccinia sorghi]|uniref:Tet-like 2OG-Fe(II) oxygenase domain-containing protein n=1 Tax=Puccinia sorghi TaxID=27349 RepID=A0A0L6UF55_9BASI|nr:hypothetical protein VP01_688g3 [Puccinia sorghi]